MLDNASKEPIRVYAKDGRKIDNIPDAVGKVKGQLDGSPKNRRKINRPKHYKPEMDENDHCEQSSINHASKGFDGLAAATEGSGIREQQNAVEERLFQNAVHVLTASQNRRRTATNLSSKPSPKPKGSPANRSPNKKGKQKPTVPRKPEDLIKESMTFGESPAPANKRDAQYRKSYAYKIWKERGNRQDENVGKVKNSHLLAQGRSQYQHAGTYFWSGETRHGRPTSGFIVNGRLHPADARNLLSNPETVSTNADRPQQPLLSQKIAAFSARTEKAVLPMSSADFETVGSSGLKIPTNKVIPPNVTVFRQPSTSETYIAPITAGKSQGIKSPVIKTPPSVKCPERRSPVNEADSSEKRFQVSKQSVDFPSSKSDDDNEPVSSRSNFISIMKTTLGEKPSKENVQPNTKRKNLDSTSDGEGPPAKKNGKSTIFTPLNEHEAEKLANDIYDVNVEYFPIKTLAEKAAQREPQPVEPENVEKNRKVEEIDKVRCLLKDFYDITFSCTEDPDMKKFDTASRRFGRKNILNHLSLLDQYFNELQKKLSE